MTHSTKHWNIVANFFSSADDKWLDDFISDDQLTFSKIPSLRRHNWHQLGNRTGVAQWSQHFAHAWAAMHKEAYGLITCFPQLAICASALKLIGISQPKILAHNFNLGNISNKRKGRVTGRLLQGIDRFIVHSPIEISRYSKWLNLPEERFIFLPLQRGNIDIERIEEIREPFILSMGSAHRDYQNLIRAVEPLNIRTVIVTKSSIINNLPTLKNGEYWSDLSERECLELLARARLSVTPISNIETASGQITFINAMHLGVPVLATRCPGTEGYLSHRENGVLLEPNDPDDIRSKIELLWNDDDLRSQTGKAGRKFAEQYLSDSAAAEKLRQILVSL